VKCSATRLSYILSALMTACRADTQKQTGVLVDAIPEGSFEWDIISRRIMPHERSVNDGMRNRTAFTAIVLSVSFKADKSLQHSLLSHGFR